LLNISVNISSISDAFDYYNGITSDDRLVIEEILTEIFSNYYYNICPSNDYSILPLKYSKPIDMAYAQYFTEDEIRISLGYEPKENNLLI